MDVSRYNNEQWRCIPLQWDDETVLVTGGAGFIDSHLTERLLELGCEVGVADDFSRGTDENLAAV